MIKLKIIPFQSSEYEASLKLREQILRKPLGLTLNKNDLVDDCQQYHLGAFCDRHEIEPFCDRSQSKLIGCVVFKPLNQEKIKLRQMAIRSEYQRKGIGSQIIRYGEEIVTSKGFSKIEMHARYSAKKFYEKLGYKTKGETFIEVGIPHIFMEKKLQSKP